MFHDNKYTKWYYQIMDNARVRLVPPSGEVHHIIPKCLGGSDDDANLALLSWREHYIAHMLLVKMHDSVKLKHAFWCMSFMNKKKYYNSRMYEMAKSLYAESICGNNHWMKTDNSKMKISASWDETRKSSFRAKVSGDNHWTTKRDMRDHAKNMRSNLTREILVENGKKSSFTTNNPMKNPEIARLFKKPKEKVQCPHCNLVGGKPVMMRYHFDRCKKKHETEPV